MTSEIAGLLRPDEALDLAHMMVKAHCEAFHGGLLLDSCGECARLEAHEDAAAFDFGMATAAVA